MELDFTHIKTVDDLKREQFAIHQRIKMNRDKLQRKMYEIPAEIAAAGANSLIPGFLKGKVSNAALNGGKNLINKFFVPEEKGNGIVTGLVMHGGLIKKVFSLFRGK
ncbi:MAG: hypothetical protein JWQ96_2148 [Segetibacter sp.]|nr:hypothetical protein [Segetibacter sp.]